MSVDNFTPQVWAAAILDNLNDAHVYGDVVNRDYEGEITAFGDTVRINSVGRVTTSAYTKNTWTNTPEVLNGAGQALTIDQADQFYFGLDDIDKAQAKGAVMEMALKEAAWSLADDSDDFLGSLIQAAVPSTSATYLTPRVLGVDGSDSDAYQLLVQLRVALDKANCPANDRWVVVDPDFIGMLLLDPRFVSFGTSENLGRAMQGIIKTMSGFTLYVSNNTPTSGSAKSILAGYKGAVTFANSIPDKQPEAFRHPGGFVDVCRGLHVYGGQVTRPGALARCDVTYSASI